MPLLDLTKLTPAPSDERAVADLLHGRWVDGDLVSKVGDIYIALRPVGLEDGHVASLSAQSISSMADTAYTRLQATGRSQTILTQGESGSGKTTAMKHLMNALGEKMKLQDAEYMSHAAELSDRVAHLLDAFGSAMTSLNPQSSRYLKTISYTFNTESMELKALRLSISAFERSRVGRTHWHQHESNFSVLHQLHASRALYPHLELPDDADGIPSRFSEDNLQANWAETVTTLKIVLGNEEAAKIVTVLGSVIHLSMIKGKNHPAVSKAARCLGVSEERLKRSMFFREAGGELLPRTPSESEIARASLAQALYKRVLDYLLAVGNEQLALKSRHSRETADTSEVNLLSIDLIDMCGFEDFASGNSLDQFLINVLNEELHDLVSTD
ncbi:P-loop containing nucleoside triphosphate hydrolase protein [Kockovaella imperatae]|uniref:p-loop containing nucleoside triphosphate hydrolase protein n=1 Tax=Kockovaella imperatae TaxID=4999 RepID=A0A1Y1U5P1_9TREE|nr:P-loop containing nucleoside triphosphate hydrolase protein [Kockovaella imperatae]ORX33349.1 P-loop containing nucleoside triphosphate hydrolase protein [Kockovaella imperatae]